MSLAWIIGLSITAYLVVGCIGATLYIAVNRYEHDETDGIIMALGMLLWPAFLVAGVVVVFFGGFTELSKLIIRKIREKAQDDPA